MNTNIVIVSGNVTKDPKLMTTGNGVNFVNFSIAVRSNQKDNNGEYVTDFFPCTAWRGTADIIHKYVKKGAKITVSGKMRNNVYADAEGKNRTSTYILIDEVDFTLPSKQDKKEEEKTDIPEPLKNFEPVDDDSENLPF